MCKVSSLSFVTRSAASVRDSGAGRDWSPPTDVYRTDSGLVVKVELAGMRSDHLEITVEGNRLRISGNRHDGCRAAKCSFLMMEIYYGPFECVLEISHEFDLAHAKAAYLNGFLRIDVPVAQRAQSSRVPVVEGDEPAPA